MSTQVDAPKLGVDLTLGDLAVVAVRMSREPTGDRRECRHPRSIHPFGYSANELGADRHRGRLIAGVQRF
jgi:hypothetical protein